MVQMEFEMFDGGPEPQNDDFQVIPFFSPHEQDNNNNNITQEPFVTVEPDPSSIGNIYIDLNSLFEDSDPQIFRAQETYPRPSADTEQNCPQRQRRSSAITTLNEASEDISTQPPPIQSKEFENLYPPKEETCQVLDDILPVAETHNASVDGQFQVVPAF